MGSRYDLTNKAGSVLRVLKRIKVFFHLKMYRIPQRKSVTKLQKLIKKNLKLNFAI